MEGACGKGGEAQVGWLKGMSVSPTPGQGKQTHTANMGTYLVFLIWGVGDTSPRKVKRVV